MTEQVIPAVSPDVFKRIIAAYQASRPGHELTEDQIADVQTLAMSERLVETVDRVPGSGVSITVRLLAQAVTASGGRVIGIAPSRTDAEHLADDLGTGHVYSLSRWLDERHQTRRPAVVALGRGDVLIVSGDRVISVAQRAALVADASAAGALVRLLT